MKVRTLAGLMLAACASHAKLPPGNELEMPERPAADAPNTVGDSKMPVASKELSTAFDPPPPAPTPAQQSNVPAVQPAVVDDFVAVREAFAQELGQAKKTVADGKWDEAAPALEALEKSAARLGPAEVQAVLELTVKGAAAQKDWRAGRRAAERWLLACGPERVEACRQKALAALGRIASQKSPEAAAAKARATAAHTADDCLSKAEATVRAKGPLPGCVEAALGSYKTHGDKLMLARAHLLKAQATAADPKKKEHAVELYEHVATTCDEQRCVSVRRRALKACAWLVLEDGDVQRAAKLMLEDMRLSATLLPDDKRRYARTSEVEKVCAQLDAREGAGACRKLEKAVVGDYTFKDFSAQKAGVGLKADLVREVNEHYGVILQECLAQEAERLKPPALETYKVEWMVLNDGRVDQVHMAHRDQDTTPLALCLRQQFGLWRYPRYDGEAQHIEQSFTVSARERR